MLPSRLPGDLDETTGQVDQWRTLVITVKVQQLRVKVLTSFTTHQFFKYFINLSFNILRSQRRVAQRGTQYQASILVCSPSRDKLRVFRRLRLPRPSKVPNRQFACYYQEVPTLNINLRCSSSVMNRRLVYGD